MLKEVDSFIDMGTKLTWKRRNEVEVKISTAQAKKAFIDMKTFLTNKNISFNSRKRILMM